MERTAPTPTQRLVDIVLGDQGPLETFVRSRRDAKRSWRLVARDLYTAVDGEFDLTYETLRSWFPDPPKDTDS